MSGPNPRRPDDPDRLLQAETALRRVATLIADGASPTVVADAVVVEAGALLAPARIQLIRATASADLHRTIDDAAGNGRAVAAPVEVAGRAWGALVATVAGPHSLATGAADRLADFSRLLATTIAIAQEREELRSMAESQGALRRVATLVAQGADPQTVFTTVAFEASRMLGLGAVSLISYDADTQMYTKIFGTHGQRSAVTDGGKWPLAECPEGALILQTNGPVRIDDWSSIPGPVAARHRAGGFGQAIAAPIILKGTIWGHIAAFAEADDIIPAGAEIRLADFTHLMATAIANVQARNELRDLAETQGALRRIATLVAQGAEPNEVFTAVAVETAKVLGVRAVSLLTYDAESQTFSKIFSTDGHSTSMSDAGRYAVDDCAEGALAVRSRQPVRVDAWTDPAGRGLARPGGAFGQAVAAPILVEGNVWGYIGAYGEAGEVLAAGCEDRLADFTQLVATAIANFQIRDELRSLAQQQGAALRRVATLVAQQAPSSTIFTAVAGEASRALRVRRVDVGRCLDDGSVALLGSTGGPGRFSRRGEYVAARVRASGQAARVDDWTGLTVPGTEAEEYQSVVGAPIFVDSVPWGVIVVLADEVLPDDTETRLTDFTHLVASSISNVNARDSLIASRARIVAASDHTRRQIERNLHDGIQQRMVVLGLGLRTVRAGAGLPPVAAEGLDRVARDLDAVLEEIRVFSQGLHPALLSRSGLGPSLRALGRRSPVPVNVDVPGSARLPEPVEIAVYYVVSEALANAAKHSRASAVTVTVAVDTAAVRAGISDDGVGGAALDGGSGLIGLVDRVEALGGRFALESPAGHGTRITIELPLDSRPATGAPA